MTKKPDAVCTKSEIEEFFAQPVPREITPRSLKYIQPKGKIILTLLLGGAGLFFFILPMLLFVIPGRGLNGLLACSPLYLSMFILTVVAYRDFCHYRKILREGELISVRITTVKTKPNGQQICKLFFQEESGSRAFTDTIVAKIDTLMEILLLHKNNTPVTIAVSGDCKACVLIEGLLPE